MYINTSCIGKMKILKLNKKMNLEAERQPSALSFVLKCFTKQLWTILFIHRKDGKISQVLDEIVKCEIVNKLNETRVCRLDDKDRT